MKNIDKASRLANYIIDMLVIYVAFIVFTIIEDNYYVNYFAFYCIMFAYYFLFEMTTSQTFGKMITKTKVVSKDGSKPQFLRIFIRSLSRLIPFDMLSYLFGSEIGMHDVVSRTKLVKKI
nr:RDD family protein [uncultured Psychroserpens sp.]